jgi:hypothetical protein
LKIGSATPRGFIKSENSDSEEYEEIKKQYKDESPKKLNALARRASFAKAGEQTEEIKNL